MATAFFKHPYQISCSKMVIVIFVIFVKAQKLTKLFHWEQYIGTLATGYIRLCKVHKQSANNTHNSDKGRNLSQSSENFAQYEQVCWVLLRGSGICFVTVILGFEDLWNISWTSFVRTFVSFRDSKHSHIPMISIFMDNHVI